MQKVTTKEVEKRLKFYVEGFNKGFHDALTGINMKILKRSVTLSSLYMTEWEKGYKEGYAKATKSKKSK